MLASPGCRLRLEPLVIGLSEGAAPMMVDRPIEIERAPAPAECRLRAKKHGPEPHRGDLVEDEPARVDAAFDLPGVEPNPLAIDRRAEQHEARVRSVVVPTHAREDRVVVVEQSLEPGARSRSNRMGVRVEDEQIVGFDLSDREIEHMRVVVAGRCNVRVATRIPQDVDRAESASQQRRRRLLSILIDHEDPVVVESGEGTSRSVDQQLHPTDVAEVRRQKSRSFRGKAAAAHAADGTGSPHRTLGSSGREALSDSTTSLPLPPPTQQVRLASGAS